MVDSKFYKLGIEGNPIAGEIVIDAHMHIDQYYNFYIPHYQFEQLVRNAQRIGIQRMYGSSLLAICNDAIAGNQRAIHVSSRQRQSQFFRPYLVYKPNYPEELEQILTLAESQNINQFKLHDDGNDLPYDHSNYLPLYEFADSKQSVVLFHTYGEKHLSSITKIADNYKRLKILLGHSGIVDEERYIDAARKCANIYLETCASMAWYGLIERLVQKAGADRVVFGTDMPFMSPDQQIGRILFAKISDEEKRNVLGLNAEHLFSA
ncbi:amidohydrolase family protein [candidate division KSB1 bacterium]|nr:amidohydrolase family protein [candidate division KSB1 bacterium]